MKEGLYWLAQFTPELLWLEGFLLGTGLALYFGFWVFQKRPFGVVRPAGALAPLKTSLDHLLVQTQTLRLQLFGLEQSHPGPPLVTSPVQVESPPLGSPSLPSSAPPPAEWEARIAALEKELAEKQKTLEQEEAARTQAPVSVENTAAREADLALVSQLQARNQELENRLNEYSVLEEDLANLKRLQQENAQLKKVLEKSEKTADKAPPPPISLVSSLSETPATKEMTPQPSPPEGLQGSPAQQSALPIRPASPEEENLVAEFEKMLKKEP